MKKLDYKWGMLALVSAAYFLAQGTALMDVVNPRYRAFSIGIFGCGGCLLGAPGPMVQGWMINLFGDRASMASLALFAFAGALVILGARCFTFEKDRV